VGVIDGQEEEEEESWEDQELGGRIENWEGGSRSWEGR